MGFHGDSSLLPLSVREFCSACPARSSSARHAGLRFLTICGPRHNSWCSRMTIAPIRSSESSGTPAVCRSPSAHQEAHEFSQGDKSPLALRQFATAVPLSPRCSTVDLRQKQTPEHHWQQPGEVVVELYPDFTECRMCRRKIRRRDPCLSIFAAPNVFEAIRTSERVLWIHVLKRFEMQYRSAQPFCLGVTVPPVA